jgi:hypothetical protein
MEEFADFLTKIRHSLKRLGEFSINSSESMQTHGDQCSMTNYFERKAHTHTNTMVKYFIDGVLKIKTRRLSDGN